MSYSFGISRNKASTVSYDTAQKESPAPIGGKACQQGFDKRESLWKRRGGAVEGKEKSFSRKGSFPLPRLSSGGEAARKVVPVLRRHEIRYKE